MGSPAESAAEFQQRLLSSVSSGFLLPCVAVGSRLKLFEKITEFTQGATSQQLADSMNFKERYVREWLDSMVCFRVFDFDSTNKTYFFPESRHAFFTLIEGQETMKISHFCELLHVFVMKFNDLLPCFKTDGPRGIPADSYPDFHEYKENENIDTFTEQFLRDMFARVPELQKKLERGIKVCDMGCGTGILTERLARLFPNSEFRGCDISVRAVDLANRRCDSRDAKTVANNLSFSVQDVTQLPEDWTGSLDLVLAFDVIHDLPHASKALQQIRNALKSDGIFYLQDLRNSSNPAENSGLIYMASLFYCLTTSLYTEGSEGLGTAWSVEKAKQMVIDAGFTKITELENPNPTHMHLFCEK